MNIASKIEHTNLKPDATTIDIIKLCKEARQYRFYGVCVNSQYVDLAKSELQDSSCKVISVVGFPFGASISKAYEAKQAIELGADEIDVVMSIGLFKSGYYMSVYSDILKVVRTAEDKSVKVIIETSYLNKQEIIKACAIAKSAGASFIKTSTGFSTKGANVKDVKLIREFVKDSMQIKAAGGIHFLWQAQQMLIAGADRLGCSESVYIVNT